MSYSVHTYSIIIVCVQSQVGSWIVSYGGHPVLVPCPLRTTGVKETNLDCIQQVATTLLSTTTTLLSTTMTLTA
jgi:hypothetical protein